MRPRAVLPILLILLPLGLLGAVAAAILGRGESAQEEAAAQAAAEAASGSPAERAVAALRTHLERTGQAGVLVGPKVFALETPGQWAVCAHLDSPQGPDLVARVIPASGRFGAGGREPMVVLEDAPGLWRGGTPGMPRQRYCGSPAPTPRLAAPEAAPGLTPAAAQEAPPPASATVEEAAATPGVTVISPVRVRAGPSGEAEILWVAERGRAFSVLGHAPGGWVQLGEGREPAGWAHSSLLEPTL
ncbi:SH3 domain-containing protein [Falsiroseomonas selenitidurans]|uniref:SH3 domain-containing protein n=1 Tax=Falsiroseomonas selenitidurans TaxID=2716335 RepID=A0ABX1E223_9PROT|nr:SH3 domain-containing protein [Falsiroseomonas selenitidurans]NKC31202.1 SH3 domain-containing protein [Falsiroseomonas selenitidurans]